MLVKKINKTLTITPHLLFFMEQSPSNPIFFHFPSFPFLLTCFIFSLMVFKLSKRSKYNNQSLKLPPGPRKLPLIGNMHQLVGSLPHHCLRDLAKKHGPLMHLQLGELSTIVVSSAEIAEEVMKTHDLNFATRPYLLAADVLFNNTTDVAFAPYGDYWRRLRKICTLELLSTKRVQSFKSIREQEVSDAIKSILLSQGSPINLSQILATLTYNIVTRAAIGKKNKEYDKLIVLIKEGVEAAGGFHLGDLFPSVKILPTITGQKYKLGRIHRGNSRILNDIIDEHKARRDTIETGEGEGEEDLVDVLLRIQENDELEFPFTKANIRSIILDVFGAGTETSSATVEWAMSELLKNPKLMKMAQAEVRQIFKRKGNVDEMGLHELKYLKLVIKETLRLHPSLPLIPRECREKCEINGYQIPAKTKVILNAWAIGRNPEAWVDAESFVPERFDDSSLDFKGTHFEYIPFGSGRRICPGISFALANVELTLAQLLFHFDWELAHGKKNEDLDMTDSFGVTIRRTVDLFVIATPYDP